VAGGEHTHLRLGERGARGLAAGVRGERLLRKAPAGERIGVAVHDRDALAAHLRDAEHRQRAKTPGRAGTAAAAAFSRSMMRFERSTMPSSTQSG